MNRCYRTPIHPSPYALFDPPPRPLSPLLENSNMPFFPFSYFLFPPRSPPSLCALLTPGLCSWVLMQRKVLRSHPRRFPYRRCCRLGPRRTRRCRRCLRGRSCGILGLGFFFWGFLRGLGVWDWGGEGSPGGETYVSVSLILALSGSSPYAFRLRASSALYLRITSPFSSW